MADGIPETVATESAHDVSGDGVGTDATAAPRAVPEARASELPAPLTAALSLPSDFRFDAVHAVAAAAPSATPALGPLAHFVGTFTGNGFNRSFDPTALNPYALSDSRHRKRQHSRAESHAETLSFSASLGSVPNRGSSKGRLFEWRSLPANDQRRDDRSSDGDPL